MDQVPAASLDADDPLNEDDSDEGDSDDDTAQLLAELARIKKERAAEQARKVWPVCCCCRKFVMDIII